MPVVPAGQRAEHLAEDIHQCVPVEQAGERHHRGNGKQQGRVQSRQSTLRISDVVQLALTKQFAEHARRHNEARHGKKHIDAVEAARKPALRAVVGDNGHQCQALDAIQSDEFPHHARCPLLSIYMEHGATNTVCLFRAAERWSYSCVMQTGLIILLASPNSVPPFPTHSSCHSFAFARSCPTAYQPVCLRSLTEPGT